MSRFISKRYEHMEPYIPGEQPKDRKYIKLNANETSCPPAPEVLEVLRSKRMQGLGRYTDPSSRELKQALAEVHKVKTTEILTGNGSDEILGLIFLTFFESAAICYPDITYGFYETLGKCFAIDCRKMKLNPDFTVDVEAYVNTDRHVILANPNAPTGYVLPVREIERIVAANPQRLVVIDEAYVDYGNESCVPLIHKYDNLLVVQTMSKSYNLAGAHVGYCFGSETLIRDLDGVRSAFNPFNLSDISMAVAAAAVKNQDYLKASVARTMAARDYAITELRKLEFYVMESHANFIFVTHPLLTAEEYNQNLRAYGILARHYKNPERIRNFLRITVGTMKEMQAVIAATRQILQKMAA